jgi:biopolymer transport protein ExbB/TolQ
MARFVIDLTTAKGTRNAIIISAIDMLRSQKGVEFVSFRKVQTNPSRSERLSEAEGMVEEAKGIVQSLQEEMQEWYDNMPENLQSSDKASSIEEAANNLQELVDNLENSDFSSVEFPGAFG